MTTASRLPSALRAFLSSQANAGILLMVSAVAALIVANSTWSPIYFSTLRAYVGPLSVLHWINDALMAVFFLLVGLEIKRGFIAGQLRTWPDRVLPGIAALGGMVFPALVYVAINWQSAETVRGWAIPTATDIAFALGVLALLGSRIPASLKIFLTALAIIDDLGAVLIIAVFYTADLSSTMLAFAALTFAALCGLNKFRFRSVWVYAVLGVVLWFFVLKSGVHATIAGVLLALAIPLDDRVNSLGANEPMLLKIEHAIAPWSAFFVVPIFAFANAGVAIDGFALSTLLNPVTFGIALGLVVGKQIGVFGATLLAILLGWARKPAGANWMQLYGIATLCGVGFTMSLFIGLLAFPNRPDLESATKIGVVVGSLICMILGAAALLISPRDKSENA